MFALMFYFSAPLTLTLTTKNLDEGSDSIRREGIWKVVNVTSGSAKCFDMYLVRQKRPDL